MTTDAKELGLLMSGPMVRAILEGRKTVTRRVVKKRVKNGGAWVTSTPTEFVRAERIPLYWPCPYGQPGDHIYIRETWRPWSDPDLYDCVQYRADMGVRKPEGLDESDGWKFSEECAVSGEKSPWKPSIFMPRWASRLTLELLSVRVERVQEISEEDAIAEGIEDMGNGCGAMETKRGKSYSTVKGLFASLWDSLNAKRGYGWEVNPWVWRMEFRRTR